MTSLLQWLIIGGGIHGTFLANLLVNQLGVDRDDLRVLDPHDTLLATWSRNTANCGMHYLRSPAAHNIDLHVLSLYRYARSPAGKPFRDFIPPYNRPSLELFRRHCDHEVHHFHEILSEELGSRLLDGSDVVVDCLDSLYTRQIFS